MLITDGSSCSELLALPMLGPALDGEGKWTKSGIVTEVAMGAVSGYMRRC